MKGLHNVVKFQRVANNYLHSYKKQLSLDPLHMVPHMFPHRFRKIFITVMILVTDDSARAITVAFLFIFSVMNTWESVALI